MSKRTIKSKKIWKISENFIKNRGKFLFYKNFTAHMHTSVSCTIVREPLHYFV